MRQKRVLWLLSIVKDVASALFAHSQQRKLLRAGALAYGTPLLRSRFSSPHAISAPLFPDTMAPLESKRANLFSLAETFPLFPVITARDAAPKTKKKRPAMRPRP